MEKKNIDWSNLGFGYIQTDKRFVSNYKEVGGQAVLGRQGILSTPWLTERHGYDPTWKRKNGKEKY